VRQPLAEDKPRSVSSPSIADVVFGVAKPEERFQMLIAIAVSLAAHAAVLLWAVSSERSLESWSASLAARIHVELSREQVIELPKAPPPPVAQEPPPSHPPSAPKARVASRHPSEPSRPPPPAQAGRVVAREPDPNAPADLTGETFVTGSATTYAGGVTSSTGTNPSAVLSRDVDPRGKPGQPDRSSPVSLEEQDWRCPWPREAEAEDISEQVALLRVVVRADGTVESASVLRDPGHGFGPAALACALRTRFSPSRDRDGRPIRSQSPPIRVRFTR
jgi:protein TonB